MKTVEETATIQSWKRETTWRLETPSSESYGNGRVASIACGESSVPCTARSLQTSAISFWPCCMRVVHNAGVLANFLFSLECGLRLSHFFLFCFTPQRQGRAFSVCEHIPGVLLSFLLLGRRIHVRAHTSFGCHSRIDVQKISPPLLSTCWVFASSSVSVSMFLGGGGGSLFCAVH